MGLLNLHCHSTYSDGADSILELTKAYKNAGHIALCLTDHDYGYMTIKKWESETEEAARISEEHKFPIIVGLEVFIPNSEEVLVFGSEACRSILITDALSSVKAFKRWYISQKEPFALILAHPYIWIDDPEFYLLMDGYEVTNCGQYWGDDYVQKMERVMPSPRKPYHGQDLHTIRNMSHQCNEVPDDLIINNEADLIKYISVNKF
jgi:hypothetical protein